MTTRMRAARYHLHPTGVLQVDEVAVPEPGPQEARVRVAYAGICGSDLARYRQLANPPASLRSLLGDISPIPGHEMSGTIDALGPDTPSHWADGRATLGASVVVHPQVACGECAACRRGYWTGCHDPARIQLIGLHRDGGFAEFVVVPFDHLLPIGELALQTAALAEPLAVAVHAVQVAALSHSSGPLCVIGDGTIGLLTAYLLQVRGFPTVVLIGRHARRLALARQMGIQQTQLDVEVAAGSHEYYSHLFHTAGTQGALELGMKLLAQGGRMVTVGYLHGHDPGLHAELFYQLIRREKGVLGACGYTLGELQEAVALLAEKTFPSNVLIHAVIGLEEIVTQGFQALLGDAHAPGKILVSPAPDARSRTTT